jgi:hypothetical protein
MSNGTAFYARTFTEVNPHGASSQGFSLITITGL